MPCYFIRAGETHFVKIGYAKDPKARLQFMQSGNQEILSLLRTMDGGRDLEFRLHQFFNEYRHRGEWFRLTDEQVHHDFGQAGVPDVVPVDVAALLAEVERYMAQHKVPPTVFGALAANDHEVIWRMNGRYAVSGLTPLKAGRIRAFLDANPDGPPPYRCGIFVLPRSSDAA